MILLPAIDLIGGRCVRLSQGDFARETVYADSPHAALADFAAQGAQEAHLVDLDGARAGEPRQYDLFVALSATSPLPLQVAGGIRTIAYAERLLATGIARVVIGSLAIADPEAFQRILDHFGPDRVTLALDVRMVDSVPRVATHGWETLSDETLDGTLARFPSLRHLLVTDIARDGMLTGPNLALMRTIRAAWPGIELQASGGVADLADLDALRDAGAARAIVGKAIWEGRFTVAQGIRHARG